MNYNKRLYTSNFSIEKFRNFSNVSFVLGKRITVISGQNGVGKSNILSLIASGSGANKKTILGSNFQPEFDDFFNIDKGEDYEDYRLYLTYSEMTSEIALTKRLSFKDDTKTGRGIRVIPRASNVNLDNYNHKQAEEKAKLEYGVGGSGRVRIPTIYLSMSRLYPLGEDKENVKVVGIKRNAAVYQKNANEKYQQWYNSVIPNSIKNEANFSLVEKGACSRAALQMDLLNTPILSQSIGQDNLGNIISALVDIYMLSLDEDYTGALMCIDEVDVSLHPDTQIRLMDLFEQLSDELNIQFVVSTHSLTILKEIIKKEEKSSSDFRVVYLKAPSAPYVTDRKSYELLEADMFGSLKFNQPKVKMYFEDKVGTQMFEYMTKAFQDIYNKVEEDIEIPYLRNCSDVRNFPEINDRIKSLGHYFKIVKNLNFIPTDLGCEELLKIVNVDEYFKRVIFVLDGDARYKEPNQKPKIRDFLEKKYNPKELGLNDRPHLKNVCFFPDYFAPESYQYRIIKGICLKPIENQLFWRSLDEKEETALYTSERISALFESLKGEYNNDDIKKILKNNPESEAWKFVKSSDIISYYYEDYTMVEEILGFVESIINAYNMAWPIMISNRYS